MALLSRIRFRWVVLLSVVAGAGCGGGDGHPIGLDELQARFIAALCKFEVECGATPDMASCTASLQEEPGYFATIDADIASGKVRWDGVKARSCLAAIETFYSTSCKQSALVGNGPTSTACDGLIIGTVAPGGACFFPEQCADGAICQLTDPACSRSRQCCPGACVARPDPVQIGGDCSTLLPNQNCVEGSACVSAVPGAARTCVVPSAVEGTACNSSFMCKSPLYCASDSATAMGTCRPAAATGAACNSGLSPVPCDDLREYCDATTGTCVPRVAVGGACAASSFDCVGYAQCVGTVCVAQPKAGEACSATSGPTCLGGLRCDAQTGTCALAPVGTTACM